MKQRQSAPTLDQASPEDLQAILRIERSSFSAPWTEKMVQGELEGNPFASFVVAREATGGGIVGYICYWVVFEELRLMNLAVDPAARRRGIATILVSHALREGILRETRRAVLEVRASNQFALALYGKMGFRQVAVRAQYYVDPVEDAILMELNPIQVEQ